MRDPVIRGLVKAAMKVGHELKTAQGKERRYESIRDQARRMTYAGTPYKHAKNEATMAADLGLRRLGGKPATTPRRTPHPTDRATYRRDHQGRWRKSSEF